jgi:vitamin B12 transporter
MKKRLLYVGALLTTVLVNAQQQKDSTKVEQLQEVIITDSRFQLKRENSGKTVIKIDAVELKKNQGKSIAEIINTKSGLEINGSRSNGGQNLSYFVRGGNNRQVLVLIDGIQVSDPSQIANDYDLRLIDINQIESIEIIKGAASTLYGNAAATAVINITTKKASKEVISAVFSSSIGTNQSSDNTDNNIADFNNSILISGTSNKFNYNASFGHQYLDGMSAVNNGTERDAFSRTNTNVKLGYQVTDNFSIAMYANHDRFTADFDNSFPIEDALFRSKSKQYRLGISPKLRYKNGSFIINAAYNTIERDIKSSFPNSFSGKSYIVDAFNKYNFDDTFYTIIGVNYIKNETEFTIDEESTIIDPYANVVWVSDIGLNLNVGARLNNHSEYGSHFTYNLNPSYTYKFDDSYLKILGSYSTSFISPNLSQLFGPFGANPTLEPETNITLEVGAELKLSDKVRFNAVFFERTEKDFIDFVIIDFNTFEGQYQNVSDEFTVNGVEVEFTSKLLKNLSFNANYTFTERKDKIALRIPKHKVNASFDYTVNTKTFIGINYQFVDKRLDTDFATFENKTLGSFSLIDVLFSHELIVNRLKLSASVSNLFNEEYTEVIGFTTKGRNYKLGLRLNF